MKAIRRATKVVQDEDTNEVQAGQCAFLWEDVVGMEDTVGTKFEYPEPRTWIWLNYAAFYIVGELDDVFAEWQAYLSAPDNTLAFTRN